MTDMNAKADDSTEDTQKGRFLTFIIGDVTYGIEMHFIREIVSLQAITEMPEMPAYIKGIINLRGVIIPVMDIRLRFGKEKRVYDDRTCVIVVEICANSLGLIVDSVSEVLSIPAEDISEVPGTASEQANRCVKNIGKKDGSVVLIVDCEKLLGDKELEHSAPSLDDTCEMSLDAKTTVKNTIA